jgi:hypothetical protein
MCEMQKGDSYFLRLTNDEKLAVYKAACALADRYRDERDGARAASATAKSKLADKRETVGDA